MVSPQSTHISAHPPFNFVRSREDLPTSAITVDNLRALEQTLEARHILPPTTSLPLWFLAETERNVCLWRHGLSVDQADEFEFWVDVYALIEKRRVRLERLDDEYNPFLAAFLEGEPNSIEELTSQSEYLTTFNDLLPNLLPHLHALSHVQQILHRTPNNPILLLPYR